MSFITYCDRDRTSNGQRWWQVDKLTSSWYNSHTLYTSLGWRLFVRNYREAWEIFQLILTITRSIMGFVKNNRLFRRTSTNILKRYDINNISISYQFDDGGTWFRLSLDLWYGICPSPVEPLETARYISVFLKSNGWLCHVSWLLIWNTELIKWWTIETDKYSQ